ncbi:zinc-finger of a C2HC-type/Double zinc ribbon [Lotmaria passim]
MFSPAARPVKGGVQRPAFHVCYLCGQQFGSASIGIHIPQCYQKKLSQWEKSDPAVRGPKPKHPDTVKWKGGPNAAAEQNNGDSYETFNSQLVPCPNCGRTFLPDRLAVHLRGCKGDGSSSSRSSGKPTSATAPSLVTAKPASARKSTSVRRSLSSGPPLLPTCYLCGQQFGTASIGIHVPQCYEKKLAQWKNADPRTRGKPPKNPDSVNWRGRPDAAASEQAAEQFQEFVNNLDPCPNCGRKFLPDRLVVHLRSCRPGNTAKPPPTRSPATTDLGVRKASANNTGSAADCAAPSSAAATAPGGDERLDPKRNRLSRMSPVPVEGRTCPQCATVEYDIEAKFCRECGGALDATKSPASCAHCGECVPQGSRFCGTCGQPVNGAAAQERTPGGTNADASTVRVVVCPACQAVCAADGNFCDNCGAALGDTDVVPSSQGATTACRSASASASASPSPSVSREGVAAMAGEMVMTKFCPSCKMPVADMAATFCEDCGSRLETVAASTTTDGGPPPSVNFTLPPDEVARLQSTSSSPAKKEASSSPPSTAALRSSVVNSDSTTNKGGATAEALVPVAAGEEQSAELDGDAEAMERLPCSHCGRHFAPSALARHERICANQKTRRVFNAAKQRRPDDAPPVTTKTAKKQGAAAAASSAAPKHDWRAESEAFRRALREARQADQVLRAGGTARDLPPPTYSSNPDYVPCPYCQRRFAPEVAQRHIPHCATTVNRPKPPPRLR